jgi:hypothetical protein
MIPSLEQGVYRVDEDFQLEAGTFRRPTLSQDDRQADS